MILETEISILVISNHNSFRVLFDKIASVYFLWKIYLYFSTENGQPGEPALCQLYRHTFVPYDKLKACSQHMRVVKSPRAQLREPAKKAFALQLLSTFSAPLR